MTYCIVKDSTVIAVCGYEPDTTDLESRGETAIQHDTATIGWTLANGVLTEPTIDPLPAIKFKRNQLLSVSDKYMLSDYPLPAGITRDQWIAKVLAYRQALRDFPEHCDTANPVYPTL